MDNYNYICTKASIGYQQMIKTGPHSAVDFIPTVIHSGVPRPVLTIPLWSVSTLGVSPMLF